MTLTYAEFCAGYGGLGLAVEEVFGAELKWYSEFDAAPSKIMAHHWPGVPNHGDMTAIDWAAVEPVDILSGGTPCQDLSAAGRRKGMTEGTRSNLWVHMREAIAAIKPTYVVWENVRGAYSASASSDLEQCPGCVGDTSDGRVFLRALGRVLGDLSDLGYDCQWRGLRAADVGSCHGRYRVFILATRRESIQHTGSHARSTEHWQQLKDDNGTRQPGQGDSPTNTSSQRGSESNIPAGISATSVDRSAFPYEPDTGHIRPEPTRSDIFQGDYWGMQGDATLADTRSEVGEQRAGLRESGQRIRRERSTDDRSAPPPADTNGRDDDGRLSDTQRGQIGRETASRRGEGSGAHANPESIGRGEGRAESARLEGGSNNALSSGTNWGEYEPAIRRWERALGRTAPRPTEPTGRNNGHRLSPRFTEWMMGLDEGWVTAPEISLTRNEQLKACGNGVVPQQAIAALQDMANYKKGDP